MIKSLARLLAALLLTVLGGAVVSAQEAIATPLPASYTLAGFTHIYQGWNNCGPATVTMALTYYGYEADQNPAAQWLKPNSEDKNVSPDEMVAYVNTETAGSTRALLRQGGTRDGLKLLIANQFPVIVESGYDPIEDPQGWMGHYLFVSGYDDGRQLFTTQDSFDGPNYTYGYDSFDEFWRHFNRLYIVLYPPARETELLALLGEDADESANWVNALRTARAEAVANPTDPFAWFNMGTNFVGLEMYAEAAAAYTQARSVGDGLPFRMMWYQFGAFKAYLEAGQYDQVLELARANLNDGGGQWVEETFYYGGLAREGLGERDRALSNLDQAILLNTNFLEARDARDRIALGG